MSTSSLIQLLETEANGGTPGTGNRRKVEEFLSGGAITAGDFVQFDASKTGSDRVLYVIESPGVATKGNAAAFGVAMDGAGAANQKVRVVTAGYAENANVAAATVAGDALVGPIGTAGRAEIEVPGTTTGRVCAIALEADTGNLADVWVCGSF